MKKMKNLFYAIVAFVAAAPIMASAASIQTGDLIGSAEESGLTKGNTMSNYIEVAFAWVIGVVGFIAILGFLISAVMYFTAAGDEEKISKAKSAMTYSIIGVIVALVGFVVMNIVQGFLDSSTL